jgi:hypothetical protein
MFSPMTLCCLIDNQRVFVMHIVMATAERRASLSKGHHLRGDASATDCLRHKTGWPMFLTSFVFVAAISASV